MPARRRSWDLQPPRSISPDRHTAGTAYRTQATSSGATPASVSRRLDSAALAVSAADAMIIVVAMPADGRQGDDVVGSCRSRSSSRISLVCPLRTIDTVRVGD